MGYELDRLMQQFGVSTPTLTYSGMQMPVKPTDLAAGASAIDRANYDALLAKYNADMPLYTSDQAKYKTYSTEYNNRMANTSLYDAPQFQRGAMSSPGTGMFTDQYSQMYQDVLGRAPDATGLAYWKGKFGDMISPEEYAQFRQSAAGELNDRLPVYISNGQGGNASSRTVLEQPTYNTPTAAPVLQTAATTAPVVLPVGDGSPAGGENAPNTTPDWSTTLDLGQTLSDLGLTTLGGYLQSEARMGINTQTGAYSQEAQNQRAAEAQAQANQAASAARAATATANAAANEATGGGGGYGSGGDGGGPGGSGTGAGGYGPQAKGGYIGRYAQGGAVRHYQAGGDVVSSMAEAERLIKALEGGKLTENEREDAMSRVAEIYRRLDEEPVQAAQMPSGMDLIQPIPESIKLTPVEIRQAIANASPLTALKEAVAIPPTVAEAAPLVRPVDPRLYGETDEVATGKGYSPMDPRLYGETDEVATGKGYSPMDPRLFGESNEVATGPGYSPPVVARAAPPAVDRTLLNLAAKYEKPGFKPTFATGSIDPGADQMALISQNAIANKIANPVVNIRPEYVDDSASRLSINKPQDTTIPMSSNMAMLQKMLLANQSQKSPYADELRVARAAATAQTNAFNAMLEKAIKGQDDNKPSNAEMYFRLAAAFGAPTKTGNFFESLAEVNKSMADQAKETRLAGKAGQALRLQLGLEGAKAGMTAAREDVTALRALTSEEMKEKASAQRELIKEYFKSGEAQSTFGKQAQDEGLTPGTSKYQARVSALSEEALRKTTAGADAAAAAAQASLASINRGDAAAALAQARFDEAKAKTKADAARLSPPELKLKIETEDMIGTTEQAMNNLRRAYALNPTTFDTSLPDLAQRKILEAAGSKDPKVIATRELENILEKAALSSLKATFPGAISDGERTALMNTVGLGAKSIEERKLIMEAGYEALKSVSERSKKRLKLITEGLYRTTTPAIAEGTE